MIDIDMLDWNLPNNEQSANISGYQPVSDNEIPCLILPFRKKNCWKNCAILLSTIDNSRLVPFLPQILEWYKDLNWPGFEIISKLIHRFADEQIEEAVRIALQRSSLENDMEWYENLLYSFPFKH